MARITVDSTITASELNDIIATAEVGSTIALSAGVYEFDEKISIKREDINIEGSGSHEVFLNFTFAEGEGASSSISVYQKDIQAVGTLSEATDMEQNYIVTDAASSFVVGDNIRIQQANDAALAEKHGYGDLPVNYSENWENNTLREVIAEVVAIDGDKVYLSSNVTQDFDAELAVVEQIDLMDNISMSGFTVTHTIDAEIDHYDFSNPFDEYNTSAAIRVRGTENFAIDDVAVIDAPSTAFWFTQSINIEASDLLSDGSHNKGGFANGKGVLVDEVFSSEFTNLNLYNNRHAFEFNAWGAEANNYVHILETNRDINFHGGIDTGNVIEVEEQVYDSGDEYHWAVVSGGSPSKHPITDIFNYNTIYHEYVVGGQNKDTITAGEDGAFIDGRNGHDMIFGSEVSDTIIAGDGLDSVSAGGGDDIISMDSGNDTLDAGAGNDVIDLGTGNDLLDAGTGHDLIVGGSGRDTIDAGAGDDTIHAGGDYDRVTTGSGNDTVVVESSDTRVFIEDFDMVNDQIQINTTKAYASFDALDVKSFNWNGDVGTRISYFDAEAGKFNSVVLIGIDKSEITEEFFTFQYTDADGSLVTLANHTQGTTASDVLYMGDWDDASLIAHSGNDHVLGGSGDDLIDLGSGNDSVDAGDGHNTIFGGSGNDHMVSGAGDDVITGSSGKDTVDAGAGNDVIDVDGNYDRVTTGLGNDVVVMDDSDVRTFVSDFDILSDKLVLNTTQAYASFSALNITMFNWAGDYGARINYFDEDTGAWNSVVLNDIEKEFVTNDIIDFHYIGADGHEVLVSKHLDGTDSSEVLSTDSGADGAINALSGHDTVYGGSGHDTIHAGDGHDIVESRSGDDLIMADSGTDTIDAGSGDDRASGGSGNDRIIMGSGADSVAGDNGNDSITGGSGNDVIDGGAGKDTIDAGSGDDTIHAGGEYDRVTTGSGNDVVVVDDSDVRVFVNDFDLESDVLLINTTHELSSFEHITVSTFNWAGDYGARINYTDAQTGASNSVVLIDIEQEDVLSEHIQFTQQADMQLDVAQQDWALI